MISTRVYEQSSGHRYEMMRKRLKSVQGQIKGLSGKFGCFNWKLIPSRIIENTSRGGFNNGATSQTLVQQTLAKSIRSF